MHNIDYSFCKKLHAGLPRRLETFKGGYTVFSFFIPYHITILTVNQNIMILGSI